MTYENEINKCMRNGETEIRMLVCLGQIFKIVSAVPDITLTDALTLRT